MEWSDIESAGRAAYDLSEEWHLVAADAADPNVMKIEFSKKGPRGGWLKGKENRFNGYLVDYKNIEAQPLKTTAPKVVQEQLDLFAD